MPHTPTPTDTEYDSRIRSSFVQQGVMHTLGAELTKVGAGEVHIELPFSQALTQQHGYLHAGVITIIMDSACGYAAYTLMPPQSAVLTVEYKVNFLSPAQGQRFVGIGKVLKPGRTLTVCQGEVWAHDGDQTKLVAAMQATMIRVAK